ncbi:MAG: zinc ribbon domain-containing protein [Anaerolineae bacterium]|nr:zinc ribbon domain-containing protein [Anaerolineae bacterium]MDW8069368.1 zinc ribbon domain-containing protein [Anaerolineae bacterium]
MICSQCGMENRPDARFCARCGAPLTAEGAEWASAPSPSSPRMSPAAEGPEPASWSPPYPGVQAAPAEPISVPRRFPILRVLSILYKVLGGIGAAITLLLTIGTCILFIAGSPGMEGLEQELGTPLPLVSGVIGGLILGLITLVSGGLAAMALYAAGEFIALLLALEENTRAIIASLR